MKIRITRNSEKKAIKRKQKKVQNNASCESRGVVLYSN
jgi:hypothetical protein